MNYPSIKTIETRLDVEKPVANTIRGLMVGDIEPDKIESTAYWINQCFSRPSDDELIMHAIDSVLENYGVESLGCSLGSYYSFAPQYSYSNTGDCYNMTVVVDNETGRYSIRDIGTMIETGKVNEEY